MIFFLTDDQDVELGSLSYMPKVKELLADEGAMFTRMYAHVPVCCPSRSSLMSGQYAHTNGCVGNNIPTNCSSPSWQRGPESRAFATLLSNAGYVTSYAGKYLNNYGQAAAGGVAHIPPGWTNWHGLVGNSVYYDYTLSNNGAAEHHGSDYATDYLPNVVLNKTMAFLDAQLGGDAPVFAVLSTPSCHGPQDAAPQYQTAFRGAIAPRTPRWNATVADTHWLQDVKAVYTMDDNAAEFSDLVYRRRLQTLLTVDDIVSSVVNRIAEAGQLNNTYFVYTADNGYHTGDYGFIYDKRQPWETDTHLPLLIRGPGIAPGTAVSLPVSMVDISASFLDMAGVPVPDYFDGSSLLPLAQGPPPANPHIVSFIEYYGEGGDGGDAGICARTHSDSQLMCNNAGNYSFPPYFYGDDFCLCQDAVNNTYSCIRVVQGADALSERARMLSPAPAPAAAVLDYRYCEFRGSDTTVELFDYTSDPYELKNLATTADPAHLAALHTRLNALLTCEGSAQCTPLLEMPIA